MLMALALAEAALMFSTLFALLGQAAGIGPVSATQAAFKAALLTVACAVSFYCCDLYGCCRPSQPGPSRCRQSARSGLLKVWAL